VLKNPDGSYNVSELDIETGGYDLIYSIPVNATSPDMSRLNAVAINPVDSTAYGVLQIGQESFLVRFDENGVELIRSLPGVGSNSVIAGAFSPTGTYYFSGGNPSALHSVQDVNTMSGSIGKDDPSVFTANTQPFAMGNVVADIVVVRGDFDGSGMDADYAFGMSGGKLVVVKTDDAGVSTKWNIGLTGQNGANTFGAAWNFHGEIYFSSNEGKGVFLVPTADLDLSSTTTLEVLDRGDSQATNANDGMNCMDSETPFPACDAGEVEVHAGQDGTCPSGSVERL